MIIIYQKLDGKKNSPNFYHFYNLFSLRKIIEKESRKFLYIYNFTITINSRKKISLFDENFSRS